MSSLSHPSGSPHPWAVLLAGGDGTRLQSLTQRISGDSRPKQFCRLLGNKSLLVQTRERIESIFRHDRTLFVVTRTHEEFYNQDLQTADQSRILAQPRNRGTGVAILTALLSIMQQDADPLVAFFPCDHYYSNDEAFARTIRSALASAVEHPKSIVLLGAHAHYPEVEYGWIEPGAVLQSSAAAPLLCVNRFFEKPALPMARVLMSRGCLWNTFVTVGHASAFLELFRSQIPDVLAFLVEAGNDLEKAFAETPAVDFSHDVLSAQPYRLLVVRDAASGWADLGNPERVIDILVRNRIEPPWLGSVMSGKIAY
jgi:mannose-1-phosphate guanylyltransferase